MTLYNINGGGSSAYIKLARPELHFTNRIKYGDIMANQNSVFAALNKYYMDVRRGVLQNWSLTKILAFVNRCLRKILANI